MDKIKMKGGERIGEPPLCDHIRRGLERFLAWLERTGFESFDPYDIWGTRYGIAARRLYYRGHVLGHLAVAPVVLMEIVCPGLRSRLVPKGRHPTGEAQIILGLVKRFRMIGERRDLETAKRLAEELVAASEAGYSGPCWGYPFDWESKSGLWRRRTPLITCTPYCFEAFLALADATGELRYEEMARSVAEFVHHDIQDTPTSNREVAAASYSPHDRRKVINASAYRAMVLTEAAHRWGGDALLETAWRNLRFIGGSQAENGAWAYAVDRHGEEFVDHFHTCFVLKNLWKVNRRLKDCRLSESLRQGFRYYRQHLFDDRDYPKSYAVRPRIQVVDLEMYDFAEAITVGCLVRDDVRGSLELAGRLAGKVLEEFQTREGYFVTRVYKGGRKHRVPFLRWPQAQMFYALTNLLEALIEEGATGRGRGN